MEAQRKAERLALIKRIVTGNAREQSAAVERPRPPPSYRSPHSHSRFPLFGHAYDSPPPRLPNPIFRVIPR